MRFFLDNGFLEYETVGTGIPVLFIHGFPLSRKMWSPQLKSLSNIVLLISIDLRGHGDLYPFDGPYTMELLADDCVKLMEVFKCTSTICSLRTINGWICDHGYVSKISGIIERHDINIYPTRT